MTIDSASLPVSSTDSTGQAAGRDYLVRSEEQLRVNTDRVPAGLARLEKFTVTETRTITVEVTHEEVRLVQTAAGDQPSASATAAGTGNSGRWMVVSREEVVVTKRVVPVDRVRLEVYPVTEQRQVTEQVRKEQIDSNLDTAAAAPEPGKHGI